MPATYSPGAGNSNGSTAEKNAWGICTRIPAPSPVVTSEPLAPRCSMFSNAVRPIDTTSCERTPFMLQTKLTPQASCSFDGS
jgi:hypothetical protein